MIRTFIAVELPDDLRRSVVRVQEKLKRALPISGRQSDVRLQWVRAESLHLTLKFLGDIEESQLEPIRAALSGAVQAVPSFTMEVEGIGAFPDAHAPRVIWAGLRAGPPQHALLTLASTVEAALVPLGFQTEEKPFSPHLTLARVKGGSRALGKVLYHSLQAGPESSGALGTLPVESVALIKSELRPTGSVYTRLFSVPLEG
jgi:RNA 2',3'-cyclic 3'-phosphodiesterase